MAFGFACKRLPKERLQGLKLIETVHLPSSSAKVTNSDSPHVEGDGAFRLRLYGRGSRRSRLTAWLCWLLKLFWRVEESSKATFHVILVGGRLDDDIELYSGEDQWATREALQPIRRCLTPIVDSKIPLEFDLLSSLFSPAPRPLTDLPSILLQLGNLHAHEDGNPNNGVSIDVQVGGKSLLQLACEADDKKAFVALLEKGADTTAFAEKVGSSVIPNVVTQFLSCLKYLLDHAKKTLSKIIHLDFLHKGHGEFHSPLHKAMSRDNAKDVDVLVSAGAKLVSIDTKQENPLHHAARQDSHKSISSAFKRDGFLKPIREDEKERVADQNKASSSANADGDTPLHVAVSKGNLKSALHLVLEGAANVNAQNIVTGDTALHIAAREGHSSIVQLLLVFGAEPDTLNLQGKTPFKVAQDAHGDTYRVMITLHEYFTARNAKVKPLPALPPLPKGSVVLLSLDGGGIRGLVLAQLLLFLQQCITEISHKDPDFPSLFDWVAGTSTGAFLALAFLHFSPSPEECKKMYFKFKERALQGRRVYTTQGLEGSLIEVFGVDGKLGDIRGPKLVLTTCIANRLPPLLHLMCNYGGARNGEVPPSELPIWEAARASSAAPTYFEEFQMKFVDGGVMSNNPTIDLMTEVFSHEQGGEGVKIGCVISLGTGIPPITRPSGSVNVVTKGLFDYCRDIKAMKNLINLFIAQCTTSYGQEVDRSRAWCESIRAPFFRFSPHIKDILLDETDDSKLIEMLYDTMVYTLNNKAEFDQLAKLLLTKK